MDCHAYNFYLVPTTDKKRSKNIVSSPSRRCPRAGRIPVQWGRRCPCRGWWDWRCRIESCGASWCWTWCPGTVHRSRCRISRSLLLALPECPILQTYKTLTDPRLSLRRLNPSLRRCGANLPVNNVLCVKTYRNTEFILYSRPLT